MFFYVFLCTNRVFLYILETRNMHVLDFIVHKKNISMFSYVRKKTRKNIFMFLLCFNVVGMLVSKHYLCHKMFFYVFVAEQKYLLGLKITTHTLPASIGGLAG